jgi:hypothetical protein
MKKMFIFSIVFTLSCIYLNAQTKEMIQSRYIEYLSSIGITASVTQNGNIGFQTLGASFNISIDEKFPNALALFFPGLIKLETDEIRSKAALTALVVTEDFYDVELFVHKELDGEYLGIRIIEYLISPDDFKVNFQNYLRLIIEAASAFLRRYNRL